jgi:hypothetical protein
MTTRWIGAEIEGVGEGLADALVLERVLARARHVQQLVAMLVEAEEDGAQLGALHDLDIEPRPARRGTSCSGTGYIMSISPDRIAATRVASLPIGMKIGAVDVVGAVLVAPPILVGNHDELVVLRPLDEP